MKSDIDPSQCRGARAMLNWTQAQLAEASGVSLSTVLNFENNKNEPIASVRLAIRRTLEDAGVIFILAGKKHGPGVRLKL